MTENFSILLVARDEAVAVALQNAATGLAAELIVVDSCDAALDCLETRFFSVLLADFADPLVGAARLFDWFGTRSGSEILTALVPDDDGDVVTAALQLGAHSLLLSKTLADSAELAGRLGDWRNRVELADALKGFPQTDGATAWIGCGAAVRLAAEKTLSSVRAGVPVLVRGARGVGKSFLLETALAVSGQNAVVAKDADVLSALDEASTQNSWLVVNDIERLSVSQQQALLAALAAARVRTAATTSSDLTLLAREGRFREDLARGLTVNEAWVPPLAERAEDLLELAVLFLRERFPGGAVRFTGDAATVLSAHDWPGNVAELRALIANLPAVPAGQAIDAKLLPTELIGKGFYLPAAEDEVLADLAYADAKKRALLKFNKQYIAELLNQSGDNLTVAAEKAGLDRSNFKKIVRKFFPDRGRE